MKLAVYIEADDGEVLAVDVGVGCKWKRIGTVDAAASCSVIDLRSTGPGRVLLVPEAS